MGLQWSSTFVRSKPSLAASSAARCSDEAEDLSFPRGSMSSLRVHILHNMLFEFLTMGRTYSYWNRPDFLLVVFLWQQHYDDEEEKTYFMRNKVQCQQWQWRLWQRQWRLWQWQGNGNDAYAYDNDNGDDNDDGDLDCLLVSFPPSPSLLPPPFPPVPLFSRSPFYHIHHLFIIFISSKITILGSPNASSGYVAWSKGHASSLVYDIWYIINIHRVKHHHPSMLEHYLWKLPPSRV